MGGDAHASHARRARDAAATRSRSRAQVAALVTEWLPELDDGRAMLRAFRLADTDDSGVIERDEFAPLLRALVFQVCVRATAATTTRAS